MQPRVAVVIPTADPTRWHSAKSIEQARRSTAHLGATVHPIQSSGADFRFSRSINRGIAEAPDADAWVLLNDDCFMDDGWLDRLLAAAKAHPEAGVFGGALRFPDGRLQHTGGYYSRPLPFVLHNTLSNRAPFWAVRQVRRLGRLGMLPTGHYHRLAGQRLDFVTGALQLITRDCLEAVGRYDEDYEFGYEDLDYSLRVLQSGRELAVCADVTGVHLQTASGGGLRDPYLRSEAVFRSKWPKQRVLELTRRGGRTGVHHGGGRCSCPEA